MISRLKKRWLRRRMLAVVLGKLLLFGSSDLAAQPFNHRAASGPAPLFITQR